MTPWRLLVAEVRRIATDPGVLLIMVVAVIAYGLIYPTPYRAGVVRDVPVVAVDNDHSELSRRLVTMVDTHAATRVVAVVADMAEAERLVRDETARGIVLVPRGLADDVMRGRAAEVVAVSDATYFLLNRSVLTGITQSVGTLSAGVEIRRLQARGVPMDRAPLLRAPIRVDVRPLFNPAESYTAYVVPAVYVLILHQTLLMGIGLIQGTSRERAARAARTVRLGPWHGLVSLTMRSLVYGAIYIVHLLLYFIVLLPRLGLPGHTDVPTLLWFFAPFLAATTWLGVAIGALFRTRESAMAIVFGLSAPLLFSSGVAWPAEAMSPWLRAAANIVPAIPAINGAVRLFQMGAAPAEVFAEWQTLWLLAGVFLPLAWLAESVRPQPDDTVAPAEPA